MLKVSKLKSGYGDLQIIRSVSLDIEPETISVLMGPNGAGKSTLLKSIFNLVKIFSGSVKFLGEDITRLPAHALLELGIGFVPQGKVNFGTMTVRDNLLIGAYHIEDKDLAEKNLEKVYKQFPVLRQKQDAYAFSLSGGQQQMLAIGRALMNLPKLLLLDEPSLGLAPKLVRELFAKIKEINESFGITILVVEHNLKSVLNIADYGYVMVQGEIIAQDKCDKLKKSKVLRKVFVGEFE